MPSDTQPEDTRILNALALALVEQPRANLQELAKAIGISKATLYRFCRTREQLIERLVHFALQRVGEAIQNAQLDTASPLEALRRLNANCLENKEVTAFLIYYWRPNPAADPAPDAQWDAALDAFFLRGQREGAFRIDLSAAALTEIWVAVLIGLVDAERRGRVARAGLPTFVEQAFLRGAAAS